MLRDVRGLAPARLGLPPGHPREGFKDFLGRKGQARIAGELSVTAISHPPSNDRPGARATFSVEGGTGDGSGRRQCARTRTGQLCLRRDRFGSPSQLSKHCDYFVNGYGAAAAKTIASAAGIDYHYLVPGASIRLAIDRSLSPSSSLAARSPQRSRGDRKAAARGSSEWLVSSHRRRSVSPHNSAVRRFSSIKGLASIGG